MRFSPCQGGDKCTEGERCQSCGRSRDEIEATKALSNQIADFILEMDYENIDHFTTFLALKASAKAKKLKMEHQAAGAVSSATLPGMPAFSVSTKTDNKD